MAASTESRAVTYGAAFSAGSTGPFSLMIAEKEKDVHGWGGSWTCEMKRIDGTEGAADFRGLIPARLWSSTEHPPNGIWFYVRNYVVDRYTRNDVAFVFPDSNKVLWANKDDLVKASDYFALMLGSSGFQEIEQTHKAPVLEQELLDSVSGRRDRAGAAVSESEQTRTDLIKDTSRLDIAGRQEGTSTTSSIGTSAPAPEDSDDEDDLFTPDSSAAPPRINRIVVRDVSYKTYRAALFWIATGKVSLAHLTSLYPSGRSTSNSSSTPSSPIPIASPKSLYRLSVFLSLSTLSALCFSSFQSQLCASNCLTELLSDLSADFEEIKEACMASVLQPWSALVENGDIEELGRRVLEGELEGRKAKIAWELMSRLKPA
ncbi:hypothetical protein JCM11251_004501 [Rhodosporidiobolus azoricus]